jgi:RNA polymerase sigma-70 factor (ECF subfamily)
LHAEESPTYVGSTAERVNAAELFTRYSAAVYRYCLRRLRSPEEAEDAVQVTYLNACRSLKGGCEPANPRSWLFQIASNVCADVLRARLGGPRLELRDPVTLDEIPTAERPAREQLLGLSEALRHLPSRQRQAVVMRDWHGLSYDEIATKLAVSDSAVETLLFRARNKLAVSLASGEWRQKLATSTRALVLWPFAVLRSKSTTLAGAEHLKAGLVVAGGAVAPLAAFGLLQLFLAQPVQTKETQTAQANAQPRPPVASAWLDDRRVGYTPTAQPAEDVKPVSHRGQPAKKGGGKHSGHSDAGKPKQTPAEEPQTTPSSAASPAPKVELCHGTHAEKLPGVTIDVSSHALGGLGDDPQGACG